MVKRRNGGLPVTLSGALLAIVGRFEPAMPRGYRPPAATDRDGAFWVSGALGAGHFFYVRMRAWGSALVAPFWRRMGAACAAGGSRPLRGARPVLVPKAWAEMIGATSNAIQLRVQRLKQSQNSDEDARSTSDCGAGVSCG